MFRLFGETSINFMGSRKYAYIISGVLIVASVISLVVHGGPRLGIDFAGGTVIQVLITPRQSADVVRSALARAGLAKAEMQSIGEEGGYLFRLKEGETEGDAFTVLKGAIQEEVPGAEVELRREETVGPKIGRELRGKAVWAVLWVLAGILVYVGWRYELTFALGAVVALFHDVFVTLGFLSFTNIEISLPVVAALLTIGGYSINDTIVLFDRIREQNRLLRREQFEKIINISVNRVLSRTVLMSLTTLFAVFSLLILGGEVIHDFALTVFVGVIAGTYSSIYVASALALDIHGPEKRKTRR
ncbi:MAG: protein translocase subunit SecF [Candidatus Eiseniibacteriota bacterium]|nr:MAG: protein translocase subunit SecF [Candidatus Eisenbacteria bacterium]